MRTASVEPEVDIAAYNVARVIVNTPIGFIVDVGPTRTHRKILVQIFLDLRLEDHFVFLSICIRERIFLIDDPAVWICRGIRKIAVLEARSCADTEIQGKFDLDTRADDMREMLPLIALGIVVAKAIATDEFDLFEDLIHSIGNIEAITVLETG